MDNLLVIEGLSKHFGPIKAVDGVDFAVHRGEVLGFLGPNGAGKSTTMRVVAGYLSPTTGKVSICGFDVASQPIEIRRRLGYLPEGAPTYADMTPQQILDFVADLRGFDRAEKRQRMGRIVERLELGAVLQQPIETLSKGFKRRVGLALALLHDPEVLILDEPTDGLDPNQKHQVRGLLGELAANKVIVISTHILEEVDALCTRAIIIAKGRIVADAKPAELLARSVHHNAVTLRLPLDQAARAEALLGALDGIAKVELVEQDDTTAQLIALPQNGGNILDPIRTAVAADGVAVNEIFVERGRLDEVFRQLTAAA